jgi:hypothetical protein
MDWSSKHRTISIQAGSPTNSTTRSLFSPCSLYGNGYTPSYFTISNSSDFNFGSSNFAMCVWISPLTITKGAGVFWTPNQSLSTGAGYSAVLLDYDNTGWQLNYSLTGSSWAATTHGGSVPSTTGSWYHAAVIRSGTNLTLYVNGVATVSYTGVSGSLYNGGYNSYILNYGPGNQTYGCNCYFDEFTIWNGSLGPVPTISQLYPQTRRMIVG